ncbi:MAG: hypothetical protein KAW52_01405, partial [candidate division Zixibacteria bacterium]|nr:hypothetical protein [candidate division Zixibacteria bacterium]
MRSVLRDLIFTVVLTGLFFFGGVEAHSVIQVAVDDTSGEQGDTIDIPVIVSEIVPEDSVYSYEMTLTFDSSVLTADSAYTTGTITEGWGQFLFNPTLGQINIAMAGGGANPLTGSGVLVYVVFVVNGLDGDTTTIHFDSLRFNDGGVYSPPVPPDTTIDGLFTVSPGSDVEDENEFPGRPTKLTLFQNYPNPFNPTTTINYSLKENSKASLNIYKIKGQKV